jgi:hypothetical protein
MNDGDKKRKVNNQLHTEIVHREPENNQQHTEVANQQLGNMTNLEGFPHGKMTKMTVPICPSSNTNIGEEMYMGFILCRHFGAIKK